MEVIRGHTYCGLQDPQYRHLMAVLALAILRDIDDPGLYDQPGRSRAAMVMPAMKTPFPRVLLRRTRLRPVFVVDPDEHCLAWQRNNSGRGAEFIRSEDGTIRHPLRNVYVTINPLEFEYDDVDEVVNRARDAGYVVL